MLKSDTNAGDNSISIGDSLSADSAFHGKIAYINIYTEKLNLYQTYALYEKAKSNMTWFEGFEIVPESTVKSIFDKAEEKGGTVKVSKDGIEKSAQDILSTGLKIDMYVNDSIVYTQEVVVPGDTSGDGVITSADYIKAKRTFTNSGYLTGAYFKAADIDKNGVISSSDYMKIKRHIAGSYNLYG